MTLLLQGLKCILVFRGILSVKKGAHIHAALISHMPNVNLEKGNFVSKNDMFFYPLSGANDTQLCIGASLSVTVLI